MRPVNLRGVGERVMSATTSPALDQCALHTKVSIIIPVYNEFSNLARVMERVISAPLPEGCEREIIIVDDGSTDGTSKLLAQYGDSGLVVVHHSVLNFGKGTAVRVGLAIATG